MAETVYRLLPGDGISLEENAGTKTVTISVPGLATKLNNGDIVQATQLLAGIAEIATNAEVQAGTDSDRIVTPAGLRSVMQDGPRSTTPGRLLSVGSFGLGNSILLSDGDDLNSIIQTGFYRVRLNHPNRPGSGSLDGQLIVSRGVDTILQIVSDLNGFSLYFRSGNPPNIGGSGNWSAWRTIYHDGNFDPSTKANTSGNYPGLTVGNSAQVGGQTASQLAPPGMIGYFASGGTPDGWLHANGAAVSRATYPALFTAIGTTYGAGNGSSTFNLPDLRGMFLRVADYGRGIDPGRQPGSSQSSANLSHSHGGSTRLAGAHAHTYASPSQRNDVDRGTSNAFSSWSIDETTTPSTSTAPDHSHPIDPDGANESRPINVAMVACIKY